MNELGNTPADKNYQPSGISRAEEAALKAYPNEHFVDRTYAEMCRGFYEEGYEQAEKDLAPLIEAAMIVYEAWNGGTMDDVRRGMVELGKQIKEAKK